MRRILIAAGALLLVACETLPLSALYGPRDPLRLNDIQVVGSHNSYKKEIAGPIAAAIKAYKPALHDALQYAHLPLPDQLAAGVRQLEIDVFADPQGGRYARPLGEDLLIAAGARSAFPGAQFERPGFKVLHIQDIDYGTHCPLFTECLRQVLTWSQAHEGHLPIIITINIKEAAIGFPGAVVPLAFTGETFDALDAEIRSVIPEDLLITPDTVRAGRATLKDAVLADGWPRLEQARGKVLFVLDAPPAPSDLYRDGHPSLEGRAMFASYEESAPEAAFFIINDPIAQGAEIKTLVSRGYMVRTRSDADTKEARSKDRSRLEAAIASGAQVISSDYYPGAPDPLGLGFVVTLPGGAMETCNPVRTAGETCSLKSVRHPE